MVCLQDVPDVYQYGNRLVLNEANGIEIRRPLPRIRYDVLEMRTVIPESDEMLLAECVVETFRAGGPGGQNVNTRDTAVRIRHLPTGIVVTSQQERSQLRNKQIALAELRRRLKELARPKRRRIPTVAPRAARRRVLEAKRKRSEKKQFRKKPRIDG